MTCSRSSSASGRSSTRRRRGREPPLARPLRRSFRRHGGSDVLAVFLRPGLLRPHAAPVGDPPRPNPLPPPDNAKPPRRRECPGTDELWLDSRLSVLIRSRMAESSISWHVGSAMRTQTLLAIMEFGPHNGAYRTNAVGGGNPSLFSCRPGSTPVEPSNRRHFFPLRLHLLYS